MYYALLLHSYSHSSYPLTMAYILIIIYSISFEDYSMDYFDLFCF